MMTPCKKLYYAVEAVLYIAYYSEEGPISSRDIAAEQGLPPRHLEQIMQKLVHGKILRSLRGPRGGYQLSRPADQISVGDICAVLHENDVITDLPRTTALGEAVVRPFWEVLHEAVQDRLMVITIEDMANQAEKQGVARNLRPRLDSAM